MKKKDALDWYKRVQDFLTVTKTGKSVHFGHTIWAEAGRACLGCPKKLIPDDLFIDS